MLDFFEYSFTVRALLAGILVALLAPLLGTFLVARRSSLLTDTLAHTSLAGVGIGLIIGISPVWGAVGASLVAAAGIEKIVTKGRLGPEAVHALFLSGGLALAVLLVHFSHTPVSFETYLFGSLATVQNRELFFLGASVTLLIFGLFFFWRPLMTLSFNEDLATASGYPVHFLKLGLAFLAAITVSLSLKIIGGLLIGALMIIPVISAIQIAKSFRSTLLISTIFAETAVVLGIFSSFNWDFPTGSGIVLISVSLFLLSLFFKRSS